MALLKALGKGAGYLKAGFLGFPKSGKTYTATLLAIGTRALFKLNGPIAFFDTESGTDYVAKLVRDRTGQDMVGVKSRSFDDLLTVGKECVDSGVSVLIVDSITHPWRALCDSYLAGKNESKRRAYESKGWKFSPQNNLEFQDWNFVKKEWAKWADFYLNAPLSIIICGRAGFEYDNEKNEETGKRELVKTGVKMKTEGEFGFEPSLLVEMIREQFQSDGVFRFVRRAYVLGDRFGVIDGKQCDDPTFDFFKPHVALLQPAAHSAVRTETAPMDVSEDGDTEWGREKKTRTILCEEITGALVAGGCDGQSAEAKKKRMDLLEQVFGTRSWTAIESANSERLRDGLRDIRARLGLLAPKAAEQDEIPMGNMVSAPGETPAPAEKRTAPKSELIPMDTPPAAPATLEEPPELPQELAQKLALVVGRNAAAALAYLRKLGWLKKGQGFEFLTQAHAEKIVAYPQKFLADAGIK